MFVAFTFVFKDRRMHIGPRERVIIVKRTLAAKNIWMKKHILPVDLDLVLLKKKSFLFSAWNIDRNVSD